jgi:hypothetical protein
MGRATRLCWGQLERLKPSMKISKIGFSWSSATDTGINCYSHERTPWPESASELYRPSDRRLSVTLVPTFEHTECRVVSVTDPYGRILGFLDRSRYFLFQEAPQLYTRGWVDTVRDPLLRKSGSPGNRIRTSGSVARALSTTPRRRPREYVILVKLIIFMSTIYCHIFLAAFRLKYWWWYSCIETRITYKRFIYAV